MIASALIVLGDDMPNVRVVGLSWPEYRMRTAMRMGARHIVFMTERVGHSVIEAIDRGRAAGVSATLVRRRAELGDLFHPDEKVLLMSGTVVVAHHWLQALSESTGATILCTENGDARFELIDARHHWLGLACMAGASVRELVPPQNDWDIASMLMRVAVRGGADRLSVPPKTLILDASEPGGGPAATRLALDATSRDVQGWGTVWLIEPFARAVALLMSDVLPAMARYGIPVALLLLVAGVLLGLLVALPVGVLLVLGAIATNAIARLAADATGLARRANTWFRPARDAAGAAMLIVAATPLGADHAPLVLALVLLGQMAQIAALPPDPRSTWRCSDLPGLLVILLGGSLFGQTGVLVALSLGALHGFATVYWLQNRLSRALTSAR